jgi:hypothetical protein
MKQEDEKAFLEWWKEQHYTEGDIEFVAAKAAWQAAIEHEQNKPIRTYRWDGIIR